jgi:hypothetical protein
MPIGIGLGAAGITPDLTVQVAFTTDPNSPAAASPTWTTIRNRVLAIDLSRSSRADELQLYQAGTATLTIRNADGAFNPVNTSGPYYGQLLPYRPIRIFATWAGVDFPLWQGYVVRWPQTWTDPVLGEANIECVDALGLLNLIALDSALAAETLLADPLVYYPLSESGGTTAGNQSANPYPPAQIVHTKAVNMTTPGTYNFGGTLAVPGSANSSGLQFTGTNNNGGATAEDGNVLTLPRVSLPWTSWSFELWCQIPKTPAQHGVIFQAVDSKHFTPLTGPIGTDPPGKISLYQTGATSSLRIVPPDAITYLDTTFNVNLADNKVHHVAVTYQSPPTTGAFVTAVAQVYVDGDLQLSATFNVSSTATVSEFIQLGGVAVNAQTLPNSPTADGAPLIGTISNVAIYDQTLALATIQDHYNAGLGWVGELSGLRAQRLLAYGGWQPALEQLEQGRSTMGPASNIAGTSLLAAVQNVSDTELGTLTVTADGLVDFRSRDDRLLKTTPTLVFGSNTAALEVPYNIGITFDYDPTLLFNDIQVTRPDGPVAESFDATSIVRFFPSVKQLTVDVDTDDQAKQAADWVLSREKDPRLRVEALTVNALGIDGTVLPYVWQGLLNLDLHDRVGIRHRPMGAPEIDMDGFVEQISHHIDARKESAAWDVTVQLSPVFDGYGVWDSPTSLWGSAVWAF